MRLCYKTRLILDNSQKQSLLEILRAATFCWNECSKARFNLQKNSIVELHAIFYNTFRKSQPKIPSQIVISSERSIVGSFASIKSNKHKINKPPVRKKLTLQLDKRIYSYKDGIFSIISLEKRVKCKPYIYPKLQEMLNLYKFGDPKIFEKNGDIWISFVFDVPTSESKSRMALGVDLGCRINAATSEGNLFVDKKFNGRKRKLRFLKRQLQSAKDKGSKTAKRHLKKIRHKEANINRDFTHKLSNKILKTKANIIVLENLKSIKVKKNKYQNKNRISQVPLYELKRILTYKAPLVGKTVIEVCPKWSSQIDSQSGLKDGERRGRRYYSKSGLIYDSDINAAINIAKFSKLPVSLNPNGIGTYGQAIVNRPIV